MATLSQVEDLEGYISRQEQVTARRSAVQGLSNFSANVLKEKTILSLLATVTADAATAGQSDYSLETILAGLPQAIRQEFLSNYSHNGDTGVDAFAQAIADLSEIAGLEGGANELRLTAGGNVIPVSQDAP